MSRGLVTILMPAYNAEQFLARAVKSVLSQTHRNFELIVVDDGSTDATEHIVRSFKDPRIRYAYQTNRGQAAALNHGLELARGVYVTTLDTDDWYTRESVTERTRFLDLHQGFGAVYGDGYYCDVEGQPLLTFSEYRVGDIAGDVYGDLICSPFFATGGNVMVRRSVLTEHSIRYDESITWCQDYDFYVRVAEKALFGLIQAKTLWYRLHPSNMTMTMAIEDRLESLIRMRLKILDSPKFCSIETGFRVRFFEGLLVSELKGRLNKQMDLFQHPQFTSLPKRDQSRLLRLTANTYLLGGEDVECVKEWLRRAWHLSRLDAKAAVEAVLSTVNLKLATRAVRWWRRPSSSRTVEVRSPLELARRRARASRRDA